MPSKMKLTLMPNQDQETELVHCLGKRRLTLTILALIIFEGIFHIVE
jgi:hypothetical protein